MNPKDSCLTARPNKQHSNYCHYKLAPTADQTDLLEPLNTKINLNLKL
jgi:hypothetical protein